MYQSNFTKCEVKKGKAAWFPEPLSRVKVGGCQGRHSRGDRKAPTSTCAFAHGFPRSYDSSRYSYDSSFRISPLAAQLPKPRVIYPAYPPPTHAPLEVPV